MKTLFIIQYVLIALLLLRIIWLSDKTLIKINKKLINKIKSFNEAVKAKNNKILSLQAENAELMELLRAKYDGSKN